MSTEDIILHLETPETFPLRSKQDREAVIPLLTVLWEQEPISCNGQQS